jgi:hypothetical protein
MSARSVLLAFALGGWLAASIVAFFIVAYTSFFGVAFIGLVICYVSAQVELDGDTPVASSLAASFLATQVRAEQEMSPEQRASVRHQRSLMRESARFFKHLGFGLIVIGVGGVAYYHL